MNTDRNLLLRALKLNAIFSGFSAVCMFIAGGWLATQFALDSATPIYIIACCLVVFALLLSNIVRTENIRNWEVIGIIIGDIGWVVGSVVLIFLYHGAMSPPAVILVVLVAIVVFIFAAMQIRSFKQYRSQRSTRTHMDTQCMSSNNKP